MTDLLETAAQITVEAAGERIVVTDLTLDDAFEMERNFGSKASENGLEASSLSLKKIERGGSITLKGNKHGLNQKLFYQDGDDIPEGFAVGAPKPWALTILHMDGNTTSRRENYVTNFGYQFSEAETAETSYEFITMRAD